MNVPACVDPRIGGAHADRVQHAVEQERPHRVAGADLATDDGGDDVGRAGRVVEDGAGVVGEGPSLRVGGHVGLTLAEEHLDHVRHAGVDVVLGPLEAVAHLQQLVERDGRPLVVPSRDAGGVVEPQPSLPHEHTDGGVQHRLRHRPRQERRVRLDGLGRSVEVRQRAPVALEQEAPALHHGDGVGGAVALLVGEHLVDDRLEPRGAGAVGHSSVGHGTPGGCGGSGSMVAGRSSTAAPYARNDGLRCRSDPRRARPRRPGCPSTARCRDRRCGTVPVRPRSGPSAVTTRGSASRSTWSLSRMVRRPPGAISRSCRPSIARAAPSSRASTLNRAMLSVLGLNSVTRSARSSLTPPAASSQRRRGERRPRGSRQRPRCPAARTG